MGKLASSIVGLKSIFFFRISNVHFGGSPGSANAPVAPYHGCKSLLFITIVEIIQKSTYQQNHLYHQSNVYLK